MKRNTARKHTLCITASAFISMNCYAHDDKPDAWVFGAVFDLSYTSKALETGAREKGLQLGHSDLTATGALGHYFKAGLVGSLATHDGKLEKELAEAWLETTELPYGLQVRAGRFASNIGYLNAQHPHADDFSERPLLYRAFYGNHWNDDGVRLTWTAPTTLFWTVGGELFKGNALVGEVANIPKRLGVATLTTKIGGDLNRSHSWQLGLSKIRNVREALVEDAHEEHHAHGAAFSGKHTTILDATWKWAPNGNNKNEQVRVTYETARIQGINQFATSSDKHLAHAVSAVWRFNPSWEVGLRYDSLKVRAPQEVINPLDELFQSKRLQEHSIMLAYKPNHMQTLRLQLSSQSNAQGFDAPAKRSVQLQYILAFGAHGAHGY